MFCDEDRVPMDGAFDFSSEMRRSTRGLSVLCRQIVVGFWRRRKVVRAFGAAGIAGWSVSPIRMSYHFSMCSHTSSIHVGNLADRSRTACSSRGMRMRPVEKED